MVPALPPNSQRLAQLTRHEGGEHETGIHRVRKERKEKERKGNYVAD